jgi:hypothetical protein
VSARRVDVADETRAVDTLPNPDYASAFEIARATTDTRTPEQWARATWEDCPRGLRLFLLTGWSVGLGLRLGPRPSPAHVLGWKIATATPEAIVLESRSRLMTGHNVVHTEGARVVWSTFMRFDKRPARALWSVAAPIHHRTIPYLLEQAAARRPAPAA